ncbi:MAG: TolC family protein [Gemmatimonadota bacterium]|nr:TolC family protein [Gemmatimonadota bacterium]
MNRYFIPSAGLVAAIMIANPLMAQTGPAQGASGPNAVNLSLQEAVARATGESEEVRLARAQYEIASAQISEARAQALPQINGTLGYTRTLASSFDTGGGFSLPDSLRFDPDPTQPLEERVRYLEEKVPLAALGSLSQLFSSLPFGQEHSYVAQVSGSQLLYAGGRVGAALNIARDYRSAAGYNLTEETADIMLQVKQAYYQALLARELEGISVAALEQAENFLAQEQLRLSAGQASELEVLRAEVARDNIRPQLVEARNAAELSELNLKRLVNIPLTERVNLTTPLSRPSASELADAQLNPEALVAHRTSVLAAERQVSIRERQVRIARGAYLPTVSLSMNYGRQMYPLTTFDFSGNWRTDWTVGLTAQVPIFNGGQRGSALSQARIELDRSRLQLSQLREAVQMQYEQARGEKVRASEAIAARERTVEQAQRVYDLTVLRYDQGLATQLEVSQSRLDLLQARMNYAQAITDFYIADAGVDRAATGINDAN